MSTIRKVMTFSSSSSSTSMASSSNISTTTTSNSYQTKSAFTSHGDGSEVGWNNGRWVDVKYLYSGIAGAGQEDIAFD